MDNTFILYTVLDTKANRFGPIFEAVNDAVAARQYMKVIDKIDVRFHNEYELYKIGEFNNVTGTILPVNPAEKLNIPYNKEEV